MKFTNVRGSTQSLQCKLMMWLLGIKRHYWTLQLELDGMGSSRLRVLRAFLRWMVMEVAFDSCQHSWEYYGFSKRKEFMISRQWKRRWGDSIWSICESSWVRSLSLHNREILQMNHQKSFQPLILFCCIIASNNLSHWKSFYCLIIEGVCLALQRLAPFFNLFSLNFLKSYLP